MTLLDALKELKAEYTERSQSVHERDTQVPLINAAIAQFCQRLLDKATVADTPALATRSPSDTTPIIDTDIVWFGKHKGSPFGSVPKEYWQWLKSQPQPIKHVELEEYVNTKLARPTANVVAMPPREKDPDGVPF